MVLILQMIKTVMMELMAQSKGELKCLTQEYTNLFKGTIPLTTSWEAFEEE
jgi:hypothetical protein